MLDFSYFYKTVLDEEALNNTQYDVFISAYDLSYRVNCVYNAVSAKSKYLLLFPEYDIDPLQRPHNLHFFYSEEKYNESSYIIDFFNDAQIDIEKDTICVDITGFLKPHLCFLFGYLKENGAQKVDVIYSEPACYRQHENTAFTSVNIIDVREIQGFERVPNTDMSNDLIILDVGYDYKLAEQIANHKGRTRCCQLFCFPPLQADMYQQSVINAFKAHETVGIEPKARGRNYFSPANDPFVTANVIDEIVKAQSKRARVTNLFLTPLSTKVHALGMCLYKLASNDPHTSLLFPFSEEYKSDTCTDLKNIWLYEIELGVL